MEIAEAVCFVLAVAISAPDVVDVLLYGCPHA